MIKYCGVKNLMSNQNKVYKTEDLHFGNNGLTMYKLSTESAKKLVTNLKLL